MTPYLIITDPKAKLRIAVATSTQMAIMQIVEQKKDKQEYCNLYLVGGHIIVTEEKFDVLIEQTLHANESILPQTEPPAAIAPAVVVESFDDDYDDEEELEAVVN